MNKQERIAKLMELLQASLDGKEIEQVDSGWYYPVDIKDVTINNVHQFRVKPNVVTKKYRVALFSESAGCTYVGIYTDECVTERVELVPYFVKWLTPWTEYTVEE